jgi:hypothetical protein
MRGHEVEIEVIVECENTQMSKGPNALVGGFRPISHRTILLKQSQSRSYRVTCPPNAEVAPNMEERQVLLIFFTYLTCTNR